MYGTNKLVWDNNALNIRTDKQKNDLISKFMGYTIHEEFSDCYALPEDSLIYPLDYKELYYQADVLEKIKNTISSSNININGNNNSWKCSIDIWEKIGLKQTQIPYSAECIYPKLEDAVFNAIYHFIDWYYRITEDE